MASIAGVLFSRIAKTSQNSITACVNSKRYIVHQSAPVSVYHRYMSSRKRKSGTSLSFHLTQHLRQHNTATGKTMDRCENDTKEEVLSSKKSLNDNDDTNLQVSDLLKSKPRMSRAQKKNRRIEKQIPDESIVHDNIPFQNVKCESLRLPDIPNMKINSKKEKKQQKPTSSTFEKLKKCVKDIISKKTDRICVLDPTLSSRSFTIFNTTKVQVVTTCLDPTDVQRSIKLENDSNVTTIIAKPLLILDVNGVLCHRLRNKKDSPILKPEEEYYRSPIAKIANTPVIPRPDLEDFLNYADEHFTLAVWTSAKSKNATKLVHELVPKHMLSKLLFIWAQHDCECDDPNVVDPNFIKDLQKVWDQFPIWNEMNTLMIDDSPEKCIKWKNNAIHPPPLNGLHSFLFRNHIPNGSIAWHNVKGNNPQHNNVNLVLGTKISDESNVIQQSKFFHKLVQHWIDNNIVQEWDNECDDVLFLSSKPSTSQQIFLKHHAKGHMGWPQY